MGYEGPPDALEIAAGPPPEGLVYRPDVLTTAEQEECVRFVADYDQWIARKLGRDTGWEYRSDGFRGLTIFRNAFHTRQAWIEAMDTRISELGLQQCSSERVTINEYDVGGGIDPHIDSDHFSNIAILSVGETSLIDFTEKDGPGAVRLRVDPGSVYVMRGPARLTWKHSIPEGTEFSFLGSQLSLTRQRLSLAFRSCTPLESEAGQ